MVLCAVVVKIINKTCNNISDNMGIHGIMNDKIDTKLF